MQQCETCFELTSRQNPSLYPQNENLHKTKHSTLGMVCHGFSAPIVFSIITIAKLIFHPVECVYHIAATPFKFTATLLNKDENISETLKTSLNKTCEAFLKTFTAPWDAGKLTFNFVYNGHFSSKKTQDEEFSFKDNSRSSPRKIQQQDHSAFSIQNLLQKSEIDEQNPFRESPVKNFKEPKIQRLQLLRNTSCFKEKNNRAF